MKQAGGQVLESVENLEKSEVVEKAEAKKVRGTEEVEVKRVEVCDIYTRQSENLHLMNRMNRWFRIFLSFNKTFFIVYYFLTKLIYLFFLVCEGGRKIIMQDCI